MPQGKVNKTNFMGLVASRNCEESDSLDKLFWKWILEIPTDKEIFMEKRKRLLLKRNLKYLF